MSEHSTAEDRRDVTWELIADRLGDIVTVADLSGVVMYASPAARSLLGYAPNELAGLSAADLAHPDDLYRFSANTAHLLVHGHSDAHADREYRFRRKDGGWIWLEGNASLLPGADGAPGAILSVFRDVTDRHAAREALREQAQRAALAEEVAGVGYWRLDARTLQSTWSKQVYRMHGLKPGDGLAMATALEWIHPEDRPASDALIAHALATGEGWTDTQTRIVRADGSIRYLRGRGICETDEAGEVTALFGTILDVTDQIEASRRLEQSERRYRLMAENATDMISTTAPDGRLTYVSPAVQRVTGYAVDELLGGQMRDHIHPDDVKGFLHAFVALLDGTSEPGPIRFRAAHKDGRWMWLESNPRVVRDADGKPVEIVDVTRDVTEAQKLKDQLRAAVLEAEAALAVKSEFLANMSHEIRTPLTAVLGFAGLLSERRDLDPEAQAQVARIAGASRALLAVVNDVLDFSKLEAGEFTIRRRPSCAEQAAREVLEMFTLHAEAKGLSLAFDPGPNLPGSLLLDEDRFRQILTNLVGNAVKFTAEGQVGLWLDYDPATETLMAEVSDTGPGIDAEAQARLFQRFSQVDGSSTRTKGGTGLGLAICRGLAEAMGGSVSVESAPGRGSTFRLALPALRAIAPGLGGVAAPVLDLGGLAGVRVLVVDDNPVNRELANAILTAAGLEVAEACDGADAVEIAASLPFDVILMDLRMPRMDGAAALAAIRATPGPNQHMPILAFSADGLLDPAEAQARGFQGQVRKPITPPELLRTVLAAVETYVGGGHEDPEEDACHVA